MLALILSRIRFKVAGMAMLACLAGTLASCAKDPPQLIADPNAAHENALPWNEQQKWEREGEAAMLNQNRRN